MELGRFPCLVFGNKELALEVKLGGRRRIRTGDAKKEKGGWSERCVNWLVEKLLQSYEDAHYHAPEVLNTSHDKAHSRDDEQEPYSQVDLIINIHMVPL